MFCQFGLTRGFLPSYVTFSFMSQGKLLRGTGIDDALVECEVFGPVVLDTALNGHHYACALTGMLIVEDVMMRLIWKAFWNIKEKHDYLVTSAL